MWPPGPWARTGGHRWSLHFALQAACADGTLYTLTVPGLQVLSRVSVFPNNPASLLCSPDCQWVFTLAQDSDLSPKVSARLCPLSQGPGFVCTGGGLCARSCTCIWEGGFSHRTTSAATQGHRLGSGGAGPSPEPLLFPGCCVAPRSEGVRGLARGQS